ncbi:hypothetical protein D3C86_1378390 [compost metagenome]
MFGQPQGGEHGSLGFTKHGDFISHGQFSVCQQVGNIRPLILGNGTGGEQYRVPRAQVEIGCIGIELHVDAHAFEFALVEVDHVLDLHAKRARSCPGMELAADAIRSLDQAHTVSALGGQDRGLTAGRPATDDQHSLLCGSRAASVTRPAFLAEGRVYHALGALAVEHPP